MNTNDVMDDIQELKNILESVKSTRLQKDLMQLLYNKEAVLQKVFC
jgi:hypothetical protein